MSKDNYDDLEEIEIDISDADIALPTETKEPCTVEIYEADGELLPFDIQADYTN